MEIFVTATGTDIGKTFVTAGIVRYFRQRGRKVRALKPVISGFNPKAPADSDTGILLAANGEALDEESIQRISPWRFLAPLSPDLAAALEHRNIDFTELVSFSRSAWREDDDIVLIEGVGGIMVPLDKERTVLDWMKALQIPALLVAGSYLGTISHTLSALDVLRHHGIAVCAIVISETPDSRVPLGATASTIARFAEPIEVIVLPRLANDDQGHPIFEEIARAIERSGALAQNRDDRAGQA